MVALPQPTWAGQISVARKVGSHVGVLSCSAAEASERETGRREDGMEELGGAAQRAEGEGVRVRPAVSLRLRFE